MMDRPQRDQSLQRAVDLFHRGRLRPADAIVRQILAHDDRDAQAAVIAGHIAMQRGAFAEAETFHRAAIAAQPRDPRFVCNLGMLLMMAGRLDEALAAYEDALRLRPDDPEGLAGKANVLEQRGEVDRARAILEPLISSGAVTANAAVIWAQLLKRRAEHEQVIAFTTVQVARPQVQGPARAALFRLRGDAMDAIGDVDGAFASYTAANTIVRRPFDPAIARNRVTTLIDVFSAEAIARLPRSSLDTERPVFVVGMPRSGSTLIEQIIHAHPSAHGAGELHDLADLLRVMPEHAGSGRPYPQCVPDLTSDDLDALGRIYLDTVSALAPRAKRIVDKSLGNFERLGLIAMLFPRARIIHTRRHPLDLCLSCFMQNLNPVSHPYASDLDRLGLRFREYARLMSHWRDVGVPMLDVDYESLVARQENESRRIIEWLGLPWHERCLRFQDEKRVVSTISYDQVRRPLYRTAVARYRRYEKHLGPLADALGDLAEQE